MRIPIIDLPFRDGIGHATLEMHSLHTNMPEMNSAARAVPTNACFTGGVVQAACSFSRCHAAEGRAT
jgi:hypothetical protein